MYTYVLELIGYQLARVRDDDHRGELGQYSFGRP